MPQPPELPLLDFFRNHVWSEIPADPSRKDRRTAAFAWGLGLPVIFGGISAWRHRGEPDPWSLLLTLLPFGALLAVSLFVPATSRHVYIFVMRVAATIGFVVSHVILTVFFFLVVTPLGWVLRATGKSEVDLAFRDGAPPTWHDRPINPAPERYHRLF